MHPSPLCITPLALSCGDCICHVIDCVCVMWFAHAVLNLLLSGIMWGIKQ